MTPPIVVIQSKQYIAITHPRRSGSRLTPIQQTVTLRVLIRTDPL
jgi:hypothetical protein